MVALNLSPLDRATLSLSLNEYQCFRQLVETYFGLAYTDTRRPELEMAVRGAFAASTCVELKQYRRLLRDPIHGAVERERLANRLTAGEQAFFNPKAQFDALEKVILPEIIDRRRATRRLRIWSAGCSGGEALYSIAMLLHGLIPDIDRWDISLLGTDINTQNLARARQGLYSEWAFQPARAKAYRAQYFTPSGRDYELAPAVRKMARFSRLNLVHDHYPSYESDTLLVDLILCCGLEDVFIEAVSQSITARFYTALVEGGWLLTGQAESSQQRYPHFQLREFPGLAAYQRLSESPRTQESLLNPAPAAATSILPELPPDSPPGLGHLEWPHRPPSAPLKTAGDNASGARERPAARLGTAELRLLGENEFEQAQALISFGRTDQARDLLLRWLTTHPSDALACTRIAQTYAGLGNWPEAERWCQIAVTVDPASLEAHYTLALILLHQGHLHQTIKRMKKAAALDREDVLVHYSLAQLYGQLHQLPQALKYLEFARRALENRALSEPVPRADDLITGQLTQAVIEMQQDWLQAATAPAPPEEAGAAAPADATDTMAH